jgi:tripartite ATP-independent transporter DctM subunit
MSAPLVGLLGFAATLVLILLRVPVAIAMAITGIAGFWVLNGWMGVGFILGSGPFEAVFPYSLSVVPLFILMGVFAAQAGLSRSLYDAVNAFTGHFRGGLAMATVGACALFGTVCGSSLATSATMCQVALPEMRRHGYDDRLATASIAAGGTLGVLIPPSVILVLYGLLTETSIGQLFVAALLPGLLATLLYMGAVWVQVRRRPELGPASERHTWGERIVVLGRVWKVLLLFLVVIGGMYQGWFSPTEAAAVGALGAFFIALMSGRLTRSVFMDSISQTAQTSGMIFMILIGASLFNYFIETSNLPTFLVSAINDAGLAPYTVLFLVILFYIGLGCVMDALSMVLLTIPFIFPMVAALDFNPVWFGIIVVTVAEIGLITPPVGMNLFVIQAAASDVRQATIFKGIGPFLVADVVRVSILVAVPAISLWLPSLMY